MKHPELFDLVHFHVVWLSALTDSAIAESGNIMLETCQKVAFAAFEVELREAFVFTKSFLSRRPDTLLLANTAFVWTKTRRSQPERGNNQFYSHSPVREKYVELEQKNKLCEWRKIIFCTEINPGQASRVLGNNEEEI